MRREMGDLCDERSQYGDELRGADIVDGNRPGNERVIHIGIYAG